MQILQQSNNKTLRPMQVAKTKIGNLTSTEFKNLQETDKSLDKLRKRIESESVERPRQWGTEVYYIDQRNGLMYRQFTSPPEKGSVVHKQLPHSLRESVLEVAHDSILGGHLATEKTYDRVTSNFFWPGAYDDMTRYCQSCDVCPRTAPTSRCSKTQFAAIPIIGGPFDHGKTSMIEGDTELTHASDSGICAVLLQEYDGMNIPVMYRLYITRKLNGAETRY